MKNECINLQIHSQNTLLSKLKFTQDKLSTKALIILCKHLAIMLEAGMNIIDALHSLSQNSQDKYTKLFLKQTIQKLTTGSSLSTAWQDKNLPPYLLSSLYIAEATGMLPHALQETANYLAKSEDERQRLKQISIYPCFLVAMLSVVSSIMIFWVLPAFAEVFMRMNMDLPLLTKIILYGGQFLQQYYLGILLGILIGIGGFIKCWQGKLFRLNCYKLVLKIPIWGTFWERVYLMQLSRQLHFLLANGISLDEALRLIKQSCSNEYVEQALQKILIYLNQGYSLYRACQQINLRNYIFKELINVGEQTGMLVNTLQYSDKFFTQEVNKFMREFTQIIEPVLLIIMGLIVGTFVMAIVLPLFQIANSVGM